MRAHPPELTLLLTNLRAALGTSSEADHRSPAEPKRNLSSAAGSAPFDDGRSDPTPADLRGTVPTGSAKINWPAYLALVDRHRLGPFLHHRAPPAVRAGWPAPVAARLSAVSAATLRRALVAAAEQRRLIRLLESEHIPVLALKGLVLAEQFYGGLGRRHIGDLDLLIRRADVDRADALLQADGLRRTRPDFTLTRRQAQKYVQVIRDFEYLREASAVRIELLWQPEGLPESETVWSAPALCTIAGEPVRTLAPALNALYLPQHGARHGWFRLFWLVDLAMQLQIPGFDWAGTMAEARRLGVERPLLQGSALAEELLGVPRPPALQSRRREQAAIAALASESMRQIERTPLKNETTGEWLRQLIYRTRLSRGPRAKFAVLAPHLFSPETWRTLPLPDRWFFLYPFATPFAWLRRRARRA